MASTWSAPVGHLVCPVCQDIFTDPVLLPCSHSFCSACVLTWWSKKRMRQCPVCKMVAPGTNRPPRNLVLKNLCEDFLLESGVVCRQHNEKLKLYCLDHQEPVCVVCRDSEQHRHHSFLSVDEAAGHHRKLLLESAKSLREMGKIFRETKVKWEKMDDDIKNQVADTERMMREEFRLLREFLLREEEVRIMALKEEERRKRQVTLDKIAEWTGQVNAVESAIVTIEKGLAEEDVSFLLKVSAMTREAQRPLPSYPQQVTGALIEVAKHLGNLSFNVWYKMKEMVTYTPVILDPNTGHKELHLSPCLTKVWCGPAQALASTPERMEPHRSVRGSEGFSSGSHSWDVEVGDSQVWALGVIAQGAQRMGNILSGLWMVRFCHGKFTAFSPSHRDSVLPMKDMPWRVTVHLDLDEGKLSFSDPDTDTDIHTFRHAFTEKLFPYVNTWNNYPLKILPRKLSVTGTQLGDYREGET